VKQEWVHKPLRDVLAVLRNGLNVKQDKSGVGDRVSRIESISDGSFDPTRVGYAQIEEADKHKFKLERGDILFSHINSPIHVGKTATFDSDDVIYHGVNLLLMRPTEDVTSAYLNLYLKSLFSEGFWLSRCKKSVNQASVNQRDIGQVTISFPALAEQKHIVAVLDQAFEAIDSAALNADRNLQNARELFDSYLGGIFACADKGWVSGKLLSFCRDITVGHVGSMATRYVATGVPFLRSQNIRPFEVSLDNVVYIDETFDAALAKSKLEPGDVAIVRTGYPGTAAVIPESLARANCADLVIVRPGPALNPNFLAAFFNSSYGKSLVGGKLVGAAQKHFNVTSAKEATLHVPPIAEQNEIVDRIGVLRSEADRLAEIYQKKTSVLDSLRSSVMNQAFSGNL
jgi:type I restriction enzyme S subunit